MGVRVLQRLLISLIIDEEGMVHMICYEKGFRVKRPPYTREGCLHSERERDLSCQCARLGAHWRTFLCIMGEQGFSVRTHLWYIADFQSNPGKGKGTGTSA